MTKALLSIGLLALLMLACGSGDASATTEAAAGGNTAGAQIYTMSCQLCHGKDGKLGFNGAKDLTVSTLTKVEMMARVAEGKGVMMPYKNMLNPKEIEAVVDYVRALRPKQ